LKTNIATTVHRRNYSVDWVEEEECGVFVVGRTSTSKREAAEDRQPSHLEDCPSFPAQRTQRIYWLQAFLVDKRLFEATRIGTHKLAAPTIKKNTTVKSVSDCI